MRSCRSMKRDAAPENAKPIKNATRAAVDVRTRPICRSKASSFERVSEPNQSQSREWQQLRQLDQSAGSSAVIMAAQEECLESGHTAFRTNSGSLAMFALSSVPI